jgi:lysophospholipase L1-like esterase
MNKFLAALIAALAVGYAVYTLWPTERSIANMPPQNGRIVMLGDSLFAGIGAADASTQNPAAILTDRFGRQFINISTPGDTTANGLGRVNSVRAHRPALVIVCLGGNDYLGRIPRDKIFSNLQETITALQFDGAVTCVVGLEPVASLGYSYRSEFRNLAYSTESLLVEDALDGILDDPSLRADQNHPNREGYIKFANRIGDVIEPVINQMPAP